MRQSIAICGLDCEKCDAYIATKDNDRVLREKTARLWSELNHAPILPEQINCDGCRMDGAKTVFCSSFCEIRKCALAKGFETCGDCTEKDTCSKVGVFWQNNPQAKKNLEVGIYYKREKRYQYVTLRDRPDLKDAAATWFHGKWNVPKEAYLECMEAYLNHETEYGWYLCLDGSRIIGGMGVIENDFHDRKDLSPNVCAVYTEVEYRCQGIAGELLDMVVEDMRSKGITPLYLVTNHTGFYERYGWEFLCLVQGDGEPEISRMYIHK